MQIRRSGKCKDGCTTQPKLNSGYYGTWVGIKRTTKSIVNWKCTVSFCILINELRRRGCQLSSGNFPRAVM